MRTNLVLLLFLCGVGLFTVSDMGQAMNSQGNVEAVNAALNYNIPNDSVAGVRYVYIQFPGDDSRVVRLQELSGMINNRIIEYNDIPETDTSDTGDVMLPNAE